MLKTIKVSENKKLIKEWDFSYNKNLNPFLLTCGSGKRAGWICKNNHKWEAMINLRNRGRNCPYCGNKKVCIDNCLATTNPKLASEWHPTKNGNLTPFDVFANTRKKVWWMCKNGHEWLAHIYSRNTGVGCSRCSNKKISVTNCLAARNPFLAAEWHPTKNGKLTPYDLTYCSNTNAWWICKSGHSYYTTVNHRNRGDDCPICKKIIFRNGMMFDSLVEAYYYLNNLRDKKFIYRHPYGNGMYCDFYLPQEKIYIEVTSFHKGWRFWKQYIKKIKRKRDFVYKNKIGRFKFIQIKLTPENIFDIRQHTVNYKDYDINCKNSVLRNKIATYLMCLRKYKTVDMTSSILAVPKYYFKIIINKSKIYKKYGGKKRDSLGVYYDGKRNKWIADIRNFYIGRFDNKSDAIFAVKKYLRFLSENKIL